MCYWCRAIVFVTPMANRILLLRFLTVQTNFCIHLLCVSVQMDKWKSRQVWPVLKSNRDLWFHNQGRVLQGSHCSVVKSKSVHRQCLTNLKKHSGSGQYNSRFLPRTSPTGLAPCQYQVVFHVIGTITMERKAQSSSTETQRRLIDNILLDGWNNFESFSLISAVQKVRSWSSRNWQFATHFAISSTADFLWHHTEGWLGGFGASATYRQRENSCEYGYHSRSRVGDFSTSPNHP